MITSSLRTGSPLPQITPCPLLDRFLLQYHGLNVIHREAGEDHGLPRSMNFDTLKNEQYLSVVFFYPETIFFLKSSSNLFILQILVCSLWELPQHLISSIVLINLCWR
jgi:hypothetical protein